MRADVIIYTKDRACQLDLLLRSVKDNFVNVNKVWLLEDWSNKEFKAGYDKIKSLDYGLDINFIKQTRVNFYEVLKTIADNSEVDYILPFCDDDVFIRNVDTTDISSYVDNTTIGINLRFSSDLTVSYSRGDILPLPEFLPAGGYLKWNWTTYKIPNFRWGYPYMAGAMIYRADFFRFMIDNIKFDLPNSFEGAMMNERYKWKKNFIVGFKHSPVINISVNRVQNNVPNRGGRGVYYSPEKLNSVFLHGSVIDTVNLYNMHNNCEFVEITLDFKEDTR